MIFDIDHRSAEAVERSFDRIAKEILLNYGIKVNDTFFRISEIEFYYFDQVHPDKYARKHTRAAGEWLFHRRGLELTLAGGTKRYGGILIRGIYNANGQYINGPYPVIYELFKSIGKIGKKSFFQFLKSFPIRKKIIKTIRYGLGQKKNSKYYSSKYRYLVDPEQLNIPRNDLDSIRKNNKVLK